MPESCWMGSPAPGPAEESDACPGGVSPGPGHWPSCWPWCWPMGSPKQNINFCPQPHSWWLGPGEEITFFTVHHLGSATGHTSGQGFPGWQQSLGSLACVSHRVHVCAAGLSVPQKRRDTWLTPPFLPPSLPPFSPRGLCSPQDSSIIPQRFGLVDAWLASTRPWSCCFLV